MFRRSFTTQVAGVAAAVLAGVVMTVAAPANAMPGRGEVSTSGGCNTGSGSHIVDTFLSCDECVLEGQAGLIDGQWSSFRCTGPTWGVWILRVNLV